MKKREGFIAVFVLIIMSIAMVLVLYLNYITYLETLIVISAKNNVQSFYNAESKILLCTNEDKYLKGQIRESICDMFRDPRVKTRNIEIDAIDLEDGDKESYMKLSLLEIDNKKIVDLTAFAKINGARTRVDGYGTVVNKLFEMEIPILELEDLENIYTSDLENLKIDIENEIDLNILRAVDSIYGFDSGNYNHITLSNNKLTCRRDTMESPYIENTSSNKVFIIGRQYNEENIEFCIDRIEGINKKTLSGIIYVEGDINIAKSLEFNGIMILNGGDLNIENDSKLTINGMLVNLSDQAINRENLQVNYSSEYIYKYGIFIPGFIDINIDLIKTI